MLKSLLCAMMLVTSFASIMAQQTSSLNDWLIVPGVRIGPLTTKTNRSDLRTLFPAASVEEGELELDEGMVQPSTIVSRNDPATSVEIVWSGKDAKAHPTRVFLCRGRQHDTCRWHTSSGITLGVRLSKLEMLNGRAFMIAGFGWDYGGNVISWNSGRLSDLECNGALILTLYGTRSKQNEFVPPLTSPEIHSISGDRPILSSTPAMQKLDPEVVGMLFEFPSANGKTCAK